MVLVGAVAAIVGDTRIASAVSAGIRPLNKPVVVSEEALVAPVTVPECRCRGKGASAAAGPAYVVLGGISLSHFLNDTMQSLIPSVYPILKDELRARLRADRNDHAGVPVHRLAAAAAGRTFHRQARRSRSRWRSAWDSRSSACCCSASRSNTPSSWSRRRWSGSARRCSIRNRRGSRGWPRADATASRNRCFRSAAISAPRWARCSRH